MKSFCTTVLLVALLATLAHADDKATKKGKTVTNSIGMKLKLIKGDIFMMGSPGGDSDRDYDEEPRHLMWIRRQFFLSVTEVTQGQWEAVMKTRPWKGVIYVKEGKNYPATMVSWNDAVAFCQRLSNKEKRKYRLPTEAEWEYACRAGTTTKYSYGDDAKRLGDYAWFGGIVGNGNTKDENYAHQVGKKKPNPWGLYDMHGNVWEWCNDRYTRYCWFDVLGHLTDSSASERVLRGGSWYGRAGHARSAHRHFYEPGYRVVNFGFRCVQVPLQRKPPGMPGTNALRRSKQGNELNTMLDHLKKEMDDSASPDDLWKRLFQ